MKIVQPKDQRGQAMVETALAAVLFVTILIFGIHFAEIGFMSLKVTEAANFALWESTRMPPHNADPTVNSWGGTLAGAANGQSMANTHYANFDGRTSQIGNPGTVATEVFTRATGPISVTCTSTAPASAVVPFANWGSMQGGRVYNTPGTTGIGCTATASITGFNIPQQFMQKGGGGWFTVPHYVPLVIPVCAVGTASGGACTGTVPITIDDWGLSGTFESQECLLQDQYPTGKPCKNTAYYALALHTYQYKPGSPITDHYASDLPKVVFGVDAPFTGAGKEGQFWMSFTGSDHTITSNTLPAGSPNFPSGQAPYMDVLPGGSHVGEDVWPTTPFIANVPYKNGNGWKACNGGGIAQNCRYFDADKQRQKFMNCFLGLNSPWTC